MYLWKCRSSIIHLVLSSVNMPQIIIFHQSSESRSLERIKGRKCYLCRNTADPCWLSGTIFSTHAECLVTHSASGHGCGWPPDKSPSQPSLQVNENTIHPEGSYVELFEYKHGLFYCALFITALPWFWIPYLTSVSKITTQMFFSIL